METRGRLETRGQTGRSPFFRDGRVPQVRAPVLGANLGSDALGRMVEQNRNGSYTQIVYSPTGGKLALMNGQTLSKGFVPLPAGAQAVYTSLGLTYYRHADWLGSSRVASSTARTCYYDFAYAPFGETFAYTPLTDCNNTDYDFTGQNQDTVNSLDDFLYREYAPTQGRWISPDPAGMAAVDPMNPQSWNQYAYVGNNPLSAVDPVGLKWQIYCVETGGVTTCAQEWIPDPSDRCPSDGCASGGTGGLGGSRSGTHVLPDRDPKTASKTAKRLACAAQFGQNHSIAAAFGAQNNFLANLFAGNSVSGLVNLGLFISGDKTPTAAQLAAIPLKGAAQGIPIPPELGHPGLSGAVGQVRSLAIQGAVAGSYNVIAGVGQETIELGITASEMVATPVAQLSTTTLSNVAFGVGAAKFAFDFSTVAYGYVFACK